MPASAPHALPRRRAVLAVVACACGIALTTPALADPTGAAAPDPGAVAVPGATVRDHAPGRLLVRLASSDCPLDDALACADDARAVLERAGLHAARVLHRPAPGRLATPLDRTWLVEVASDADIPRLTHTLTSLPDVELASPDWIGTGAATTPPNDPWFGEQWALEQVSDKDIDVLAAWEVTVGKPRVVIAVLDSGLDPTHGDFAGDRVVAGYDFVNDDPDPVDDLGHGTHVAGIAAAGHDDGVGVAGVCPGCSVMAIKVLDAQNIGLYSWWVEGITWAVDHGASVINLSAGGVKDDAMLRDAVRYAASREVAIVAAMMNFDNDVAYYPAAWPETIAVGATDRDDLRAAPFDFGGGSNYGPHIDLVAPGNEIQGSLYLSGTEAAMLSGTSQAAPLVAGTAGLLLTVDEHLTIEDVRGALTATALDRVGRSTEDTAGFDPYHGHGRLNAAVAVRSLASMDDLDGDGHPAATDCDDLDDEIHPGAVEVPGNGVDDDCDPSTRDDSPADTAPPTDADIAVAEPEPIDRDGGGCCATVAATGSSRGPVVLMALALLAMLTRRRRRPARADAP